jgi:hypothetical protein
LPPVPRLHMIGSRPAVLTVPSITTGQERYGAKYVPPRHASNPVGTGMVRPGPSSGVCFRSPTLRHKAQPVESFNWGRLGKEASTSDRHPPSPEHGRARDLRVANVNGWTVGGRPPIVTPSACISPDHAARWWFGRAGVQR